MDCPACGTRATRRARFCAHCGARLEPRPAARANVSPASIESGDRRVVTALFADLVDYVQMIAEHDPEDVRDRVQNALRRMAEAIERLDGTREKFIGDAVFAIFGWPRAHDDDPVRAALAALAIRAALREPDDGGEPLEVRIGLATGEVVAAPSGDGSGDLSVTGEAITTAARIQSLAQPGEILLDEATVRGGRDRLSVDDRGSVILRGQSSSARIYALTGEIGLTPSGSRRATDSPLVGRAQETARIRKVLRRVRRSGHGAVVLLAGEAGMGKSRLLTGLESEARQLGYAWTWTESVSYGRGEPYRFGRMFAQAVADEHGDDSGAFVRRLLFEPGTDPATARRYGAAIAAVAREAAFSGWEEEARFIPDDPAETAAMLVEVAEAYIDRLMATYGPRVIVLDDVHWLDASSAAMVEMIVTTAAVRPLVVLAAIRPGPEPAWASLPHVEQIELAGLAPPETAQLATIVAEPRSTPTTHGGSTSGRRATRCSSGRPFGRSSRTAASSCGTGG